MLASISLACSSLRATFVRRPQVSADISISKAHRKRVSRAFDRTWGHPLEFVPLSDPSTLRVGDTLRVRLLLMGKLAPIVPATKGSGADWHMHWATFVFAVSKR